MLQLKLRLLDSATGLPVVLSRFRLSFFDFDEGNIGRGKECLSTRSYSNIRVYEETQLVDDLDPIDASFTAFCSTQYGVLADNPTSPFTITPYHKSKAIEVTFENTSQVELRFTIF